MAEHKSLTEVAYRQRREAHAERKRGSHNYAGTLEREAGAMLTLDAPPDVGVGGEVVEDQTAGLGFKRACVRDTLAEGRSRIAEDASIRRTDLLLQPSFNCLPLALDAAESIGAANGLEKMLAHQMAVAHEAALRLMDRALSYEADGRTMREGDSIEACRLANSAARLMSCFQDGLATLQRLRTGGNQTVTVQHVTVASGAQAIVGNVRTGGPADRGDKAASG